MGWLRNLLVFPDATWEVAATKVGGEFVQGTWLGNSEIRFSHGEVPVKLEVQFSENSKRSTQSTKAIPKVTLRPGVKLMLFPQMTGLLGAMTGGLLSASGKEIEIPVLSGDYQVIGDDVELANELFGNSAFVSALRDLPTKPTVAVGGSLRNWGSENPTDTDEDGLYVSVPKVLKDASHLIALVTLTKTLLDLLHSNNCLAS